MSAFGPLAWKPGSAPLSSQMALPELVGSNWSPATALSRARRKVSVPLPVLLTTKDSSRSLPGEVVEHANGVRELMIPKHT